MFTLNITVAPKTGSRVPTGTVVVLDGKMQLAMPTLVAGAASYSTSTLAAGTHSITVTYSGDSNFATSTSAAISLTVSASAKINTTTSLYASAENVTSGTNITFTAKVAPQSGSGTPTGTVSFLDAQSQIGSAALAAGSAQFSTMSLAAGTHTITAAYSGDANNNASTSAATSVTAAPTPDYSLSMSSSALTVAAGTTGNFTLTVTPEHGFKSPVTFACSGLPVGATCDFSPATVNTTMGPVSTALTIQAPMANAMLLKSTDSNEASNVFGIGNGFVRQRPNTRIFALWILTLAFAGMFGIFRTAGRNPSAAISAKFTRHFVMSVMVAAILGAASCAGTAPQKQPTPSQNTVYTVTVNASAANTPTHTQSFTLTVTP
jgi:uncharacterized membrane protein